MAGLCLVTVFSGSIGGGNFIKSQITLVRQHQDQSKWQDEMDQGIQAFRDTAYTLADSHFGEALKLCAVNSENFRVTSRWLGVTAYEEEQDLRAVSYLQNSLRLTRKFYDKVSFETADLTLWNAHALERAGDYPKAEALYVETLAIYEELADPLSSDYNNAAVDYANFLTSQNRLSEALDLAQKAYGTDLHDYGIYHKSTLNAGKCLAKIYNRLGLMQDAELLVNQNLELSRQIYGEKTLQTAQCYLELANHCSATKDYERANLLYGGIIDMLGTCIGPGKITMIDVERDYARSLNIQGNSELAKKMIEQSIAHAVNRYGKEHPVTRNLISKK